MKEEAKEGGFEKNLEHLIISMYTLIDPGKIECGEIRIIKEYYKGMSKENDYLVWDKDEKVFIIAKYEYVTNEKTKKQERKKTRIEKIEIPKKLKKIIKRWLKDYNTEGKVLLVREKKGELVNMTEQEIRLKIKEIFKERMEYRMGITDMRKAYKKWEEEGGKNKKGKVV